jgi:hypothetical protein
MTFGGNSISMFLIRHSRGSGKSLILNKLDCFREAIEGATRTSRFQALSRLDIGWPPRFLDYRE